MLHPIPNQPYGSTALEYWNSKLEECEEILPKLSQKWWGKEVEKCHPTLPIDPKDLPDMIKKVIDSIKEKNFPQALSSWQQCKPYVEFTLDELNQRKQAWEKKKYVENLYKLNQELNEVLALPHIPTEENEIKGQLLHCAKIIQSLNKYTDLSRLKWAQYRKEQIQEIVNIDQASKKYLELSTENLTQKKDIFIQFSKNAEDGLLSKLHLQPLVPEQKNRIESKIKDFYLNFISEIEEYSDLSVLEWENFMAKKVPELITFGHSDLHRL